MPMTNTATVMKIYALPGGHEMNRTRRRAVSILSTSEVSSCFVTDVYRFEPADCAILSSYYHKTNQKDFTYRSTG